MISNKDIIKIFSKPSDWEPKIGNYITTEDCQGSLISGKIISICELKEALLISIQTEDGVRTVKL